MTTDEKPEDTPTAPSPADEQAAYEAGLRALLEGGGQEEATEEKPADAEPEATDEAAPEDDEEEDDELEEGDDAEGDDEKAPKVAEGALRKLQKEKRTFERHKSAVLEHERTVNDREAKFAERTGQFDSFVSRLAVDPIETLIAHNYLNQADLDYFAKMAFLRSSDGLKDPRSKGEAERMRRERARDIENKRAMGEVEKIKAERAAEKTAQEEERTLNEYTSRIKATVSVFKAKTPLLTTSMANDPVATERELWQVAYELGKASGQFAEPGKVILAWERQERARLERRGYAKPSMNAVQEQAKTKTAVKSQGQKAATKSATAAAEPAEEILEGDAYHAELRKRLKQSSI